MCNSTCISLQTYKNKTKKTVNKRHALKTISVGGGGYSRNDIIWYRKGRGGQNSQKVDNVVLYSAKEVNALLGTIRIKQVFTVLVTTSRGKV